MSTLHYASMLYPAQVLGDPELFPDRRRRCSAASSRSDNEISLIGQWQACIDFDVTVGCRGCNGAAAHLRLRAGRSSAAAVRAQGGRDHASTADAARVRRHGALLDLRPSPRDSQRRDPQDRRAAPIVSARDRAVVTADGRGLLVREWGSLDGSPVIAHHGTPSCRLARPGSEADDGWTGVRVISFDRPGYGGSPPRPGRNVGAAAEDVAAIADALGLERFAVYGVSGGGPHALACAALLGERVTRVAVSGSVAPADDPQLDWFGDMHPLSVPELRAAMQGRAELRAARTALRGGPAGRPRSAASDAWLDGLPASDRRILLDPARRELDAIADVEANRQAGEGWIDDDLALVRPWGFELESIAVPVRLWHGEADILIPPTHSRRLARRIPAAELVLAGAGALARRGPPGHAGLAGRTLRRSDGSHGRVLGVEHATRVRRRIDRHRAACPWRRTPRPSRRPGRSCRRCHDPAPPARASVRARRTGLHAPRPSDGGLDDVTPHLRVDQVEVGEERVAYRFLRRAEKVARAPAATVDHDHAALLLRAVHEIGVVEEHVEAHIRRVDRVESSHGIADVSSVRMLRTTIDPRVTSPRASPDIRVVASAGRARSVHHRHGHDRRARAGLAGPVPVTFADAAPPPAPSQAPPIQPGSRLARSVQGHGPARLAAAPAARTCPA